MKNRTGPIPPQTLLVPVNPGYYAFGDKVVRKEDVGFNEIEEMAQEFDLTGLLEP